MNFIINEDINTILSSNLPWEELKDKIVLVTGASGFIGSYLIHTLAAINESRKLNMKIICIIRSDIDEKSKLYKYIESSFILFLKHDISQPIPNCTDNVDIIFHCASQASPRFY
jgi:UDP-glucuronate decarboxylase